MNPFSLLKRQRRDAFSFLALSSLDFFYWLSTVGCWLSASFRVPFTLYPEPFFSVIDVMPQSAPLRKG